MQTNIIISDEDWEETFKAGHKLTKSQLWREFDWKVRMMCFNTPSVTSNYSNTSEMCWRICGLIGDFTHIFWDCPKLLNSWRNIWGKIWQIFGSKLVNLHYSFRVYPLRI